MGHRIMVQCRDGKITWMEWKEEKWNKNDGNLHTIKFPSNAMVGSIVTFKVWREGSSIPEVLGGKQKSDSFLRQAWQGKWFSCLPKSLRFLKFPIPPWDEHKPVGVKQRVAVKALPLQSVHECHSSTQWYSPTLVSN